MKIIKNFFKTLWTYILFFILFGNKFKAPPKEPKCKLPGCPHTTSHRGGYCCPEHKHMHKELSNGM